MKNLLKTGLISGLILGFCTFAIGTFESQALAADTAVAPPSNSLPATGPQGDHPCANDAKTICPGKTYGKGLVKCMKENKAKLAPACQEKLESFFNEDRAQKGEHPCANDAKTICPGKTYGQGLVKCMKENKAKLAPACQEKLESFFSGDRAKRNKK